MLAEIGRKIPYSDPGRWRPGERCGRYFGNSLEIVRAGWLDLVLHHDFRGRPQQRRRVDQGGELEWIADGPALSYTCGDSLQVLGQAIPHASLHLGRAAGTEQILRVRVQRGRLVEARDREIGTFDLQQGRGHRPVG